MMRLRFLLRLYGSFVALAPATWGILVAFDLPSVERWFGSNKRLLSSENLAAFVSLLAVQIAACYITDLMTTTRQDSTQRLMWPSVDNLEDSFIVFGFLAGFASLCSLALMLFRESAPNPSIVVAALYAIGASFLAPMAGAYEAYCDYVHPQIEQRTRDRQSRRQTARERKQQAKQERRNARLKRRQTIRQQRERERERTPSYAERLARLQDEHRRRRYRLVRLSNVTDADREQLLEDIDAEFRNAVLDLNHDENLNYRSL